uniref:Uncharacterized protein n=2 Tax=Brassica oleracea TaxID=3712 RepID=A0A0D3DWX5_BRAOL|nr:unnamed protein product [Brassica oleracea]
MMIFFFSFVYCYVPDAKDNATPVVSLTSKFAFSFIFSLNFCFPLMNLSAFPLIIYNCDIRTLSENQVSILILYTTYLPV